MRAEYWAAAGLILSIAEIVAPGTFLIFFAAGALATAVIAIFVTSLTVQLGAFSVVTVLFLLAGNSLYRRLLSTMHVGTLGRGPIGEQGVVEERIVNGRGKVRVRDISWLATGPDLAQGTPIVVTGRREGTLLEVDALHSHNAIKPMGQ